MGNTVLLIGLKEDVHIRAVALALDELGVRHVLFDPTGNDELPKFSQVFCPSGELAIPFGDDVSMNEIGSVFCRYAIDGLRPSHDLPDIQKYAMFERIQALLAPLRSIDTTRWINDPWMEARSDCKVYQWGVARSLGLSVPRQIVSDDLDKIETVLEGADAIVKPLSDASLGVTNDETYCDRMIPTDDFAAPYTSHFDAQIARQYPSDGTPLLVQEKLRKSADLRCMVIDEMVYAFAIPYRDGASIDFRTAEIQCVSPFELRRETRRKLVALNRKMRVRYSACDLVLTTDGEEVFLEANVSGNWLFCDVQNGMEITREISRRLAN